MRASRNPSACHGTRSNISGVEISLRESIESARKKNFDFIIGNILGSNIFNIAIVISISGLFTLIPSKPLHIMDLSRDMIMILITMASFYIIIKNYNYLATKTLCVLLLILLRR